MLCNCVGVYVQNQTFDLWRRLFVCTVNILHERLEQTFPHLLINLTLPRSPVHILLHLRSPSFFFTNEQTLSIYCLVDFPALFFSDLSLFLKYLSKCVVVISMTEDWRSLAWQVVVFWRLSTELNETALILDYVKDLCHNCKSHHIKCLVCKRLLR